MSLRNDVVKRCTHVSTSGWSMFAICHSLFAAGVLGVVRVAVGVAARLDARTGAEMANAAGRTVIGRGVYVGPIRAATASAGSSAFGNSRERVARWRTNAWRSVSIDMRRNLLVMVY